MPGDGGRRGGQGRVRVSDADALERLARLLEEVRDNQRIQLERQAEALGMQKEQLRLVLQQHEKAARLQDRAESIQERSAQLIKTAQRSVPVLLVVVILLIIYVSWLMFR